jgi:ankyrin repeat protein
VIVQAGLNFLFAAAIVLVARWRQAPGGRIVIASFCLSAIGVLLSLAFAPIVGSTANRNLWIETPLVEAARYGDAELVTTLINKGANPNSKQSDLGTTALHYMVARAELKAVEALVANGADPNARANTSLETPLHWAVRYRANVLTIQLLVNHGADPTLEDWHGRTPVEYTETIPNPVGADMRNAL